MGDKSPKANQKAKTQKQAKASAAKSKPSSEDAVAKPPTGKKK